jgi:hypothetical protein
LLQASGNNFGSSRTLPRIVDSRSFDGFDRRVERLGLSPIRAEVTELITGFDLRLSEDRKNINGAAAIRVLIDRRFAAIGGWRKITSGGIDWTKCLRHNGAEVCAGVELQISARSDLLTNDLTHLMRAIEQGSIDVGIIVVPADATARFLPDRCPRFSYAVDHVERAKAQFSPLLLMSFRHDGIGPPLPKVKTRQGRDGSG